MSNEQVEALASRLFDTLCYRLRGELLLERDRAGALVDTSWWGR
jgi:hypothetical protein